MSYLSDLSKLLHYLVFRIKKTSSGFDKASLIISADIDVGSSIIAEINNGICDSSIHDKLTELNIGKTEEKIIPVIIQLFNNYEIPVTFGIRGQLTEVDSSIFDLLLKSNVKHDIGAHGYYHRPFNVLSTNEANEEIKLLSEGMDKYGIKPTSFIFPRNEVNHLSVIEDWGYTCFRGKGNWLKDGLYIKKYNNLYDIHPSLYLGKCHNIKYLNQLINLAVLYKAPFHIWFHPRELGNCENIINKKIVPLLKLIKEKEKKGQLNIETMSSITKKCQTSI